jgi:hypothetical protein
MNTSPQAITHYTGLGVNVSHGWYNFISPKTNYFTLQLNPMKIIFSSEWVMMGMICKQNTGNINFSTTNKTKQKCKIL